MAKKTEDQGVAATPPPVVIKPTVGRVVLFTAAAGDYRVGPGEHRAAIVAAVNDDGTVNLGVYARSGETFARENVPLVQDGEAPPAGCYCEWMQYQKGQAAKAEALEKKLEGK